MKSLALWLTCLSLLWLPLAARAESGAPTPESTDTGKWIRERVRNASQGQPERVRLHVTGCMPSATCPTWFYVGRADVEDDEERSHGVILLPEKGVVLPTRQSGREASWGPELVIEGSFTGVVRAPKTSEGSGDPDSAEPSPEFKVASAMLLHPSRNEPTLQVLLSGEEARKQVSPFGDKRRWLVLVSNKPLFEPESEKQSQDAKKQLLEAGFKDAEVFDSRKAPQLLCCYLSVAAGRYETEAQAQTTLKALKKKGFQAYIRQGW
ncbi:hypothetical protein [Hyalangium versicolor]|uniref:hypothetical protein n=1 Tax=Hyalangium versicolor TaxID=2861190 RepID=UPI001CCFB1CC|nr:hypothetical protein [Hyalangium versicolor]